MNLFLDTNIYLSFYHFSSDDLEELRKLNALVYHSRIRLYSTEQVHDEFRRNRENKIADALNAFRNEKITANYPNICRGYQEYSTLRRLQQEFDSVKRDLYQQMLADATNETFKADHVIDELFVQTANINISEEIMANAERRHKRGIPPGKKDSLGDAINWECLLAEAPDGVDLHFVSSDSDYCSQLDKNQFSAYLTAEWQERKASQIIFHPRLSGYFKKHHPNIKLARELEKDLAIENLADSPNFRTARLMLRRLVRFGDFSDAQINAIANAVVSNNQVHGIADDTDIGEYLDRIFLSRQSSVEPGLLLQLSRYWKPKRLDNENPNVNGV